MKSYQKDLEAMPAGLRALLEAELAAGNEIAEVGHSFPAPPVGAYFLLTKPLQSRVQKSGDGIDYYDRNNSSYSGEITDAKRFYFILEPARPPEPEPDMNAIRAAHQPVNEVVQPTETKSPMLTRFQDSMEMDFDKWHDGTGYDLEALRAMSAEEKKAVESMLIARGASDWRDIEALAFLDTAKAQAAVKAAINSPNSEVRNAVTRYAPGIISESARTLSLVQSLETAVIYGGLTQALDQVAEYHPQPIVEALLRGALNREGGVAVHFAAMLYYIHGQASEPFDMSQRPFFLRFNTEVRAERETVFRKLCKKIRVDPAHYLAQGKPPAAAGAESPGPVDYTVELDYRGELLTYCELNRSTDVICIFSEPPRILPRTLSNWYYPLGRRSEEISAEEKQIILSRIADYCRKHHHMANVTFET